VDLIKIELVIGIIFVHTFSNADYVPTDIDMLVIIVIWLWQVEQCRHLAKTLISSYPECDTPGLIRAAQYARQKNTAQAIECLKVSSPELCVNVTFCVRT